MVGGGAALVGATLLGPRLGRFNQARRSCLTLLHLEIGEYCAFAAGKPAVMSFEAYWSRTVIRHRGYWHLLPMLQDGHVIQFANASAAHMTLGVFILWLGWCAPPVALALGWRRPAFSAKPC